MTEDKEVAYLNWDDGKALAHMNDSVQAYDGIQKASGFNSMYGPRTFNDISTNLSIKSDFNREDYNRYRPSEAVPCDINGIIQMCMKAYDRIGLVRQAIDLMGDFACQGINLVHPNKKIEKFYQKWFKKVNGSDRSERFLNMFYRAGNVVVYRLDGKIQVSMVEDWRKAYGADADLEFEKINTSSRVIPAKYVFYHPLSVDVIGSPLSTFSGKPFYALKINAELRSSYHALRSTVQRSPEASIVLNNIPQNISDVLKNGGNYVSLDQEKISAYHYKKDDWQVWANPMLYSVLDDLIHLEKLKLADSAALDGAISNIRLWNLGIIDTANPNNSIMPTRVAINKLRNLLANNVGGGTLDLIWGPELKFTESNSQVHHYLGPEKYVNTLSNIYVGLGIPPVLAGGTKDGGFTNNYITIKTLVERLEYGRGVLVQFWNGEIERVQKAMGFRFPAQVTFDKLVLSDEAAEKKLLMDMVDRDLISVETLRNKFDIPNEIEEIRIKRDEQKRGTNVPHKASPFHNPQQEDRKSVV